MDTCRHRAPASVGDGRVLRLALSAGELHRVPRGMHNVQVLSGIAWITVDGQDVVAERGSCVQLPQNAFPALVSRLGGETLVFEIW